MIDAVYNRCLRIAQMAINNTKRDLCSVNKYARPEAISIKLKSKDELVVLIDKIMSNPYNAMRIYKGKIQDILIVETNITGLQGISNPEMHVFVRNSISI